MLLLCREGKMDLVVDGLFRVPHFEGKRNLQAKLGLAQGLQIINPLRRSQNQDKRSRR
jgi:hypothetical protein